MTPYIGGVSVEGKEGQDVDDNHAGQTEQLKITAVMQARIQQEIIASGLQDGEIATRTGLSASQIGRMRRGEADNLTVKSLLRLSSAFGRPPEYWLGGQAATELPPSSEPREPQQDVLAANGIQAVLLRGFADLDEQAQLEIVRFVNSVRRLRGMTEVVRDTDS